MARELREVVFVDGVRTAVRQGRSGRRLLEDARRRHGGQGRPRAPAPQPERSARAHRRRDPRRDGAGRRPGPHPRARRRAARGAASHRAGLRRRPHVRGRPDGDDRGGRRDRDGRGRPRHRRRRRAHGPSHDGRRGRLQPALRQRAADRRERRRDGADGREPPRHLPPADARGAPTVTPSRASAERPPRGTTTTGSWPIRLFR